MSIIDEDGDLFGVVNVVDALVVLLVCAFVASGVMLVSVQSEAEPKQTGSINATVELGPQAPAVAEAISEGDTYSPGGNSLLTITDVVTSPDGERVDVLLRVRMQGLESGSGVLYGREPPRLGRTVDISTSSYSVSGDIVSVGGDRTFETDNESVVVRDRLSVSEARALDVGDEITVGGRTVATVTDTLIQPTDVRGERLVFVTVSLETVERDGTPRFGRVPVSVGRELTLPGDGFTVDGEIERVASNLSTTRKTVVVSSEISTSEASAYTPGTRLVLGGKRVLTLRNVTFQPTDDPDTHRVLLTLDMTVVEELGTNLFGGQSVVTDGTLRLRHEDLSFDGRIRQVGSTPESRSETVVVRTRLQSEVASDVNAGDRVVIGGQTVLTIRNKTTYATEDTGSRIVFVEADVRGIETDGVVRFGDTPVVRGQAIRFQTDEYTVGGEISRVGEGLDPETVDVVFTGTVDSEIVDQIDEGDRSTVGESSTVTVEAVTVYGTSDPDEKRVVLGLSLTAVEYRARPYFGGDFLQRNGQLSFRTDEYELSGTIQRVGTTQRRGTVVRKNVTLQLTEVRQSFARAIRVGLTEQSGDRTVARLIDVERTPSTILIRGERGNLSVYEHPTLRDVTVTADLQLRQTADGLRFKSEPIRIGEEVVLDLGVVTVEFTVVSVGG